MTSALPDPPRVSLAYVLAPSHSGSTLLAMLLGSHPSVCTVGEIKATAIGEVDGYLCSCRAEIRDCPFWKGISEDMGSRGIPFVPWDPGTHFGGTAGPFVKALLRPLHRGPLLEAARDAALALSPSWRREFREVADRNRALLECIAGRTGKPVVVDSSKIGTRLKFLLRIPSVDVKVIRLVRDGRAVALTYTDQGEYADAADPSLRGGGTGARRMFAPIPMEAAAREWKRATEEGKAIAASLGPSRAIEVRYESLCADPEGEMGRLFDFLGVARTPILPLYGRAEHHVIGNGMRLDSVREVRLDDRWRSVLDPASHAAFDRVAGRLNREMGYR